MTTAATSSKWNTKGVTAGSFLLCFVIVGVPFWNIPYASVTLPNAFYGLGVIAVFATAAVLCLAFRFSLLRSTTVAACVFPAVLMARVVVEASIDPSRHNLWPLALIIAAVMGVVVAGVGALAGWLAARLLR